MGSRAHDQPGDTQVIGITPGFEPLAYSLCQSLAESGPVMASDFDDEWTPAGETYRDELVTGGLVAIDAEGLMVLTGEGVAFASGPAPTA